LAGQLNRQTMPPVGGRPNRPEDFADLQQQWIDSQQTNNYSPDLERRYYDALSRRDPDPFADRKSSSVRPAR